MGLNPESCYGAGLNVSTLITFTFQKHNPYHLKGMLAVVIGETYYEHIAFSEYIKFLRFYILSAMLKKA